MGIATPLPWIKVLIVGAVIFADTFGSLVIFPFMPFMVHDFFPNIATDQLGFRVGILASAFHLGGLSGSVMVPLPLRGLINLQWGKLADIYGRRPIMIFGLIGTFFSISMFGFSSLPLGFGTCWPHLTVTGFLNGNIGVAKSYLSEICDNSNMAKGFSILGLTSGLGRLYPSVFGSAAVLVKFPYALPCMAGALICLLTLVMAWFHLTETLKREVPAEQMELDSLDMDDVETEPLWGPVTGSMAETAWDAEQSVPGAVEEASETDVDRQSLGRCGWVARATGCVSRKGRYQRLGPTAAPRNTAGKTKMLDVIGERGVWTSTSLYGFLAFVSIAAQELFTLWTITDTAHGGFHFSVADIGFVLLMSAPVVMVLQAFLFPWLVRRFTYCQVFQGTVAVCGVLVAILPSTSRLQPADALPSSHSIHSASTYSNVSVLSPLNSSIHAFNTTIDAVHGHPGTAAFIVVSLVFTAYISSQVLAFAAIMVMINNSCLSRHRGTVNGLGQSLASLARLVSPTLGGIVFAWSEQSGLPWPLDFHFVWLLLGVLHIGILGLSLLMPRSINAKQPETLHCATFQAVV